MVTHMIVYVWLDVLINVWVVDNWRVSMFMHHNICVCLEGTTLVVGIGRTRMLNKVCKRRITPY